MRGPVPTFFGHGFTRGQAGRAYPATYGWGNLNYHRGGSIMPTNKTYAIYWVPPGYSVDANYESLINGFFSNVAADSGKTTNVFYAGTQYYQSIGGKTTHVGYASSFGGSTVDATPFPANGCSDSYTSVCLSDAQITKEIDKVVTANNWSRSGSIVFMFTPKGVGSCISGSCAFSDYCAYHSNFQSTAGNTLYANMPYADTVPAACDAGYHPNNDDADPTISVVSHEMNETITDPLGNAWYDWFGYEDGDKCAWSFPGTIGTQNGSPYNQVIGTGKYEIQPEYSNYSRGCVTQGK